MPFKTILVALTGNTSAFHVADTAFEIASLFNSHVVGVDTALAPLNYGADLGVGLTGSYYEELYKVTEKVAAHMREMAKTAFETVQKKRAIRVSERPSTAEMTTAFWSPHPHGFEDSIVVNGRVADLIVLDQPGSVTSFNETQALETALFQTGRPTIMVPKTDALFEPKHAVIAWNGSLHVCGAVTSALPFLRAIETISVVQIGDIPDGNPNADYLSEYLGWHDIKAVIHHVADNDEGEGAALLGASSELKADMIIMGAYARSPLRETVFGGMTRHVTYNSKVPVLFMH